MLTIVDVNEPPSLSFSGQAFFAEIDENSMDDTPIGDAIESFDVDIADRHQLTYSLTGERSGIATRKSGWEVRLVVDTREHGELNFESGSRRSMKLVARDSDWSGAGALSSEMEVTVHLQDVNDPPRLVPTRGHATDLSMPRDMPLGAQITSLAEHVYDEDAGSSLTFTLDDDDDGEPEPRMGAGWIAVDSETGALTLDDARAYCDALACNDDVSCNAMSCDENGLVADAEGGSNTGCASSILPFGCAAVCH